jgi:hypothetical protein
MSMPVQVLFIGVVLTLMGVLLGHLIFTAQYHWPLSRTNFILQVASVVTLLISQVVLLQTVFRDTKSRSSQWPYMFEYVAIDVPPFNWEDTVKDDWSTGAIAGWQLMSAVTSGIIQVQFCYFFTPVLLFTSSAGDAHPIPHDVVPISPRALSHPGDPRAFRCCLLRHGVRAHQQQQTRHRHCRRHQ